MVFRLKMMKTQQFIVEVCPCPSLWGRGDEELDDGHVDPVPAPSCARLFASTSSEDPVDPSRFPRHFLMVSKCFWSFFKVSVCKVCARHGHLNSEVWRLSLGAMENLVEEFKV